MAIKTFAQLVAAALVIKNETIEENNTALRVGGFSGDFLDSLDSLLGRGWEFVLDGQYLTQPNALAIPAGTRTKITVDGNGGHLHSPNFVSHFWSTINNKFEPLLLNDFYGITLALTGQSVASPENKFEIEFDVNGTAGVIGGETKVFAKGAGQSQRFEFSRRFFAGTDFLANGGSIYITPEEDIELWEIAITSERTYTPLI